MSMTMSAQAQAKLFSAFAKKVGNPNAALSATEEAALAAFMPAADGGPAAGLPAGPAGDARGSNDLRRTNWFNGRFLTAEALRRQDGYFDLRGRLDAQALMPGVAYGLGLSADGLNASFPVDSAQDTLPVAGGFPPGSTITLSPGLAFDQIGRPILVSQPFGFTLEQLVTLARATPRRVAPGGTEFAPCVCVVPDPAGPTGGAPFVKPGPYLLIIEAGETPEGEAKVYGEVCSGPTPVMCQSESWRGGFGLSLVRVPLELPAEDGLNTAWALRGTVSAWWFDVFEHSLIRRWDPPFATDDGFAAAAGSGRNEAGTVALAMVWLGTDGSAIFVDRWIPRRSPTATPGEDWHRTRFGAPPRAAAWARIHQFQAMLAESLQSQPLVRAAGSVGRLNLWLRGFRHIPPIGFLPLDPAAIGASRSEAAGSTGVKPLDRLIAKGGERVQLVSGLIAAAKRQAFSYFRNTNVLSYCAVALHDDDILEDLANVFDKDPVQITRRVMKVQAQSTPTEGTTRNATSAFVENLGAFFDVMGLDELVNRRTEVVKIILPLQGLSRVHPVLGIVPQDARTQAADWLGAQPPSWWSNATTLTDAFGMAQLPQNMPLDMLPRHFAVYVKQRMVLLDVLVTLIEMLEALVFLARDTQRDATTPQNAAGLAMSSKSYSVAYSRQPAERRALAEAALSEPLIREAVARAAIAATPDLRLPARNAAFTAKVAETDAALVHEIPDPALRQQEALGRVSDAYAAEHPGFAVVQVLAAVQTPDEATATFAAISTQAMSQPLRDAEGARTETTVADTVTKEGPVVFEKPGAASVYATLSDAVAEKAAATYVAGAPAGLTARDVLARSPAEAARLLGGADKLQIFTEAVAKEKAAARTAAETVTAAAPPADVTANLAAAVAGGQDAGKAVETMQADAGADQAKRAYLEAAGTMIRTLGADRTLKIARLGTFAAKP